MHRIIQGDYYTLGQVHSDVLWWLEFLAMKACLVEGQRDGEWADDVKVGGCAVANTDEDGVEDDAGFQRVGHYVCLGPCVFLVKGVRCLPTHSSVC